MDYLFKPHISASEHAPEFTLRAILLGLIFGVFFAIANAYLALKLGTTISASIPAAILSMSIMRLFKRKASALENNIVQTIATVGEGLAAGVVFTIPALIILGEVPSISRIFILSVTGGILGILLMIPMRRHLIVNEHKRLPFPEGTACAMILKSDKASHHSGLMAIWGLLIASGYKICSNALFLWKETVSWTATFYEKAIFSIDTTPALLGVGYIIGPTISGTMFTGGLLAWWVIIPLIKVFGLGSASVYPSTVPIIQMGSAEIWNNYVRYIGAGTLAMGGMLSLGKIFPLLIKSLHVGFSELFKGPISTIHIKRTDRDISMSWLLIGSLAVIAFLWLCPGMPMNLFTVILLVILSFFFVGVTALTVGLVGSTSNPVSGMTITTILITCLIFVLLGWTERVYLISAITMSCVACCAICLSGTTAQDLKTGFLLGSTPKKQQIAELIGVIIPSLALGYTIYILNQAYGIGSPSMPAPQATMIAMIADGVMSGNLPYPLFGAGAIIGIVMALLGVPVLSFGLGLYLPLSLSSAIMVGGLVRAYIDKKAPDETVQEKGILFSAGLIGGDACIGILIALLTVLKIIPTDAPSWLPDWVSFASFLALAYFIILFAGRKK